MLINKMEVPRTRGGSARRRAVLLLASALVAGGVFAAVPANTNASLADSVRITSNPDYSVSPDSVRITSNRDYGVSPDSVRITLDCDGTDREHILCTNP